MNPATSSRSSRISGSGSGWAPSATSARGRSPRSSRAVARCRPASPLPDVPPWSEHERLTREKAVLGFFISGHPLAKYRAEVELFGTRTTATLGLWTPPPQKVTIAAVVTVVKRQIAKKKGAEYARLTLEDFHGAAEGLVFPGAWAKLNSVIRADGAYLLTGGYSPRDRGEEQAAFIVDGARALDDLRPSGAIGVALRWGGGGGGGAAGPAPEPETARAIAALCAAHPGPTPVFLEWRGAHGSGNGTVRLKSRTFRVDAADDLMTALRDILGVDGVTLVRA